MLGMLMMWVLMVCIMVEVFAEPAVTFTFLSITDNYKLRGNITRIPAAKLAENAHLVCNTGDIISPYAEAYVDHGRAMLRLYQATNVSLSTVGNHDVDFGRGNFCKVIQESNGTMQWVLSNLKLNCSGPVPTQEYIVVPHEGKRIAFIGLLSNNMSIYNQKVDLFGGATIEDPVVTAARLTAHVKVNDLADTIVILSHMSLMDEIRLAESGNYSVIAGGHEVDYFVGQVNGCWILKVGENIDKYGLIKLIWPNGNDTQPTVTVELKDTIQHPQDPELVRIAQEEHEKVAQSEMSREVLGTIPTLEGPMTTRTLRREQSAIAGWLLANLVQALPGSDGAMVCSGNLRGSEDYCPNQNFTFFDLLVIAPFLECLVVRVRLPGAFIAEIVRYSRSLAPESHARYMQLDSGMRWDEATKTLTHIANAPLEPDRIYSIVIYEQLLLGMDIAAVKEYVAQHPEARDTTLAPVDLRDVLRAHMTAQLATVEGSREAGVSAEANVSVEGAINTGATVSAAMDVSVSGELLDL